MSKEIISDLRSKILLGVDIAFKQLIEDRVKSNGNIAITKNGKVVLVKAVDFCENDMNSIKI